MRTGTRSAGAPRALTALAFVSIAVLATVGDGATAAADGSEYNQPGRYTVSVSPRHGVPGSTFQATLTVTGMTCDPLDVTFYLDGAVGKGDQLAPPVTMPSSCRATTTIKAPASWAPGESERIVATYVDPTVPRHERTATFTVDEPGPPSSASRNPTQARPNPPPTGAALPSAAGSQGTGALGPGSSESPTYTPPSVRSVTAPSPDNSIGIAAPASHAEPTAGGGHVRGVLLWIAVLGIVVVGLFGGWAARREARAMSSAAHTRRTL